MVDTVLTAADIAALERALVKGELEVEYDSGGTKWRRRYRSVDEMMTALTYAKAQVDASSATARRVPSTLAVFDRD